MWASLQNEISKIVPVNRFGIVAAMSKNRVIGLNGKIPWRLPADRKLFKDLTNDKILIVGRRTFEEEPNKLHISHARHCIVVSTTMDPNAISNTDNIHLSRSFLEALNVARLLVEADKSLQSNADDDIYCWVAGGQAIYQEALKHPAAQQLHLTVVDVEVDDSSANAKKQNVAFFPSKYRWDNQFEQNSRKDLHNVKDMSNGVPDCTYYVYKRRQQKR